VNALLVYWHPEPKSFNHAMFGIARETLAGAGWQVQASDLHAMRFDPVSGRRNFTSTRDRDYLKLQLEEVHAAQTDGFAPEIETELRKLEWCDLMIWQFPLWWFALPAALKGWVDRVFAMGRAYGDGRKYENGVFRGKRALLSLTTGGLEQAYRNDGANGDIFAILRPIHRGMLQFVGFDVLAPQIVFGPVRLSEAQRAQALACYAERLRGIASEPPIAVGPY